LDQRYKLEKANGFVLHYTLIIMLKRVCDQH